MYQFSDVAICIKDEYTYPDATEFFRPSVAYPEYPFKDTVAKNTNMVYERVRECFSMLEMDKEHHDTEEWNPLRSIIVPGNKVLIKPNFVTDINGSGDSYECLYTHPSVIAAVVDYVILALTNTEGQIEGEIVIGDAPMQDCNFDNLVKTCGLDRLIEFYNSRGIKIKLVDYRAVSTVIKNGIHEYTEHPIKSHIVKLDEESEFAELSDEENRRMRKGANDPEDLFEHHHKGTHEYEVCDIVLNADVVINMPKPKTHKKAGVTISLKNMVGINVRKEYLPHHTEGDKESGLGDAYWRKNRLKEWRASFRDKVYIYAIANKKIEARIMRVLRRGLALIIKLTSKDKYTEGHWHGNETVSKTIVDLNKILFYADKNGVMQDVPQRKQLIIADMVISGEGDGPVAPTAKKAGIIAVGRNPVCFDECIATIMGAIIGRIPTLRNARSIHGKYKYVEKEEMGRIISNKSEWNNKVALDINKKDTLNFIPIPGWYYSFHGTASKTKEYKVND